MATDYPDIIGEYISVPTRFEVDGLQYIAQFEPKTIDLDGSSTLVLYFQNVLNTSLDIAIKLNVPQKGRFRGQPILAVEETEISLSLKAAEVGYLKIPVITTPQAEAGDYEFGLEFKVNHSKNSARIRKPKPQDPLSMLPVNSMIGLNLVSILGAAYNIDDGKKLKHPITITNKKSPDPQPKSLNHEYNSLWDIEISSSQHQAQVEVNDVRVHILEQLKSIEPIFVAFFLETQQRFIETGLALHLGEAIALGKLLTYTVHLFLSNVSLQDGLLCPIWEQATFNRYPTTNPLNVIRHIGYNHVLRLAIAISFNFIGKACGKQVWSQEEQLAVADYLIEALDEGAPLEIDFLYLPLMMGTLTIAKQVKFPGEDVKQTIQLIKQAQQSRPNLFADEEMTQAKKIYNGLLQKSLSQ